MDSKFNLLDHIIIMESKSKNKETGQWTTTKVQYLPVAWRLYWFRIDNPKGKIDSHALTLDLEKGAAIFETYVEREDGGSARMHGSETAGDWKDYIEKAQTKSLGRALAACRYGSQFTDDEFTEGERIADSPVVATGNGRKVVEADAPKAAPGTEHLVNGNGSPAFPERILSARELYQLGRKGCAQGTPGSRCASFPPGNSTNSALSLVCGALPARASSTP